MRKTPVHLEEIFEAAQGDLAQGNWHPRGWEVLPTSLSVEWKPEDEELGPEIPAKNVRIFHEGIALASDASESQSGHFALDLDRPRAFLVPWSERERHRKTIIDFGVNLEDVPEALHRIYPKLVRRLSKHLKRTQSKIVGRVRFGAVGRENRPGEGEFLENHWFLYAEVENRKGERWLAHASHAPYTLMGWTKARKQPWVELVPLGEIEPASPPGI